MAKAERSLFPVESFKEILFSMLFAQKACTQITSVAALRPCHALLVRSPARHLGLRLGACSDDPPGLAIRALPRLGRFTIK
jgi:hypothetical protein